MLDLLRRSPFASRAGGRWAACKTVFDPDFEQVGYADGGEGSVYEHMQRVLDFSATRVGRTGICKGLRADWNDCLNLNCFSDTPGQSFQTTTNKEGKVAESVFIAGLFVLACQEMIGLADHYINREKISPAFNLQPSTFYSNAAAEMEKTVWASGWDGEWFRRAYDDFGRVLGSKENTEGQIFIEPQGICVMAGLGADNGNAVKRSILRSPLEFTRISSGFTPRRMHPILGTNRPHLAVDYAAPTGTPVIAVANGRDGGVRLVMLEQICEAKVLGRISEAVTALGFVSVRLD